MEEMEKMAKGYTIRRIHVIKAAKILKLGGVTGGVIRRSETAQLLLGHAFCHVHAHNTHVGSSYFLFALDTFSFPAVYVLFLFFFFFLHAFHFVLLLLLALERENSFSRLLFAVRHTHTHTGRPSH